MDLAYVDFLVKYPAFPVLNVFTFYAPASA
jgi:hypothetical protein